MFAPLLASADGHIAAAQRFVALINNNIIFPIIALLLAVATLVFFWGAFQYLWKANEPAAREVGAQHMLWGIIGIAVMLSAYALLQVVLNTFFPGTTIPV